MGHVQIYQSQAALIVWEIDQEGKQWERPPQHTWDPLKEASAGETGLKQLLQLGPGRSAVWDEELQL